MRRRGKPVSEGLAAVRRGEGAAGRLRGDDAKAQARARHDGAVEARPIALELELELESNGRVVTREEESEDVAGLAVWATQRVVPQLQTAEGAKRTGAGADRARSVQSRVALESAGGGRGSGEWSRAGWRVSRRLVRIEAEESDDTTTPPTTATATRKWQGRDERQRCSASVNPHTTILIPAFWKTQVQLLRQPAARQATMCWLTCQARTLR